MAEPNIYKEQPDAVRQTVQFKPFFDTRKVNSVIKNADEKEFLRIRDVVNTYRQSKGMEPITLRSPGMDAMVNREYQNIMLQESGPQLKATPHDYKPPTEQERQRFQEGYKEAKTKARWMTGDSELAEDLASNPQNWSDINKQFNAEANTTVGTAALATVLPQYIIPGLMGGKTVDWTTQALSNYGSFGQMVENELGVPKGYGDFLNFGWYLGPGSWNLVKNGVNNIANSYKTLKFARNINKELGHNPIYSKMNLDNSFSKSPKPLLTRQQHSHNKTSLNEGSVFVYDDKLDNFVEIQATPDFIPSESGDPVLELIEKTPAIFVNDQYLRKVHYTVFPEEAKKSEILRKLSQMTGKEQDEFFISNIDNSVNLMHQRGLDGGYDRLRKVQEEYLKKFDPEDRRVLQNYQEAQLDPKYFSEHTNSFDFNKYIDSLKDSDKNRIFTILNNGKDQVSDIIFSNLSKIGIERTYKAPIMYDPKATYNAFAVTPFRQMEHGKDMKLLLPRTKAHEIHHLLTGPTEPMDYKSILYDTPDEYLHESSLGTESTARYSQLLNALGIKTDRVLLPEEFEFLSRNYTRIPYYDINNNMTEFFQSIKDPKKFIKWASSTALGLPLLIKNKSNNER